MKGIVGREAEIRELQERYSSDRAQFVAVYGRSSKSKLTLSDINLRFNYLHTFIIYLSSLFVYYVPSIETHVIVYLT